MALVPLTSIPLVRLVRYYGDSRVTFLYDTGRFIFFLCRKNPLGYLLHYKSTWLQANQFGNKMSFLTLLYIISQKATSATKFPKFNENNGHFQNILCLATKNPRSPVILGCDF